MVDALAFVKTKDAAMAMLDLATVKNSPVAESAKWWVNNRRGNEWHDFGLGDVMKPKSIVTDGFAGAPLREGRVAAAVQQISELKFTGAHNIVPLPDELQVQTVFTVAELRDGEHAGAEQAVHALTSPEAAASYQRSGATPLFP